MNIYTRRQIMHLLGISAAGLLTGCACRTFYSIDDLKPDKAQKGLLSVSKTIDSTGIKALDAHVHIFNAADMQAAAYVSGPMANELEGIFGKLLSKLEKFIEHISCRFCPSAADEVEMLNGLLGKVNEQEKQNKARGVTSSRALIVSELIEQGLNEHKEKIVDEMIAELPEDFWKEYEDLGGATASKSGGGGVQQQRRVQIESALKAHEEPDIVRRFGEPGTELKAPRSGIFAFLRNMMSYRFHNLTRYMNGYRRDNATVRVDGCFVSLVDFNYWLGKRENSYTLLEDQIKLMEYIVKLSEGYVIPIVAYNPWVDVERGDESINLVKKAIMDRGFVGIKIYPTLGYRPHNKNPIKAQPNGRQADHKKIQTKLDTLYQWSLKNQVPIMAHSNHSMGTSEDSKKGAGPAAWTELIKRKGYEKLQVHLGHFGHGEEVDGKNWTTAFSDMMVTLADNQVYADLAYWDDLWREPDLQNLLKDNLPRKGSNGVAVIDRLMYGSDWHMMSRIKNWHNYPASLHAFLKDILTSAELKKFFFDNVLRLYRLDGGKNLIRLKNYHKRLGVQPDWYD